MHVKLSRGKISNNMAWTVSLDPLRADMYKLHNRGGVSEASAHFTPSFCRLETIFDGRLKTFWIVELDKYIFYEIVEIMSKC